MVHARKELYIIQLFVIEKSVAKISLGQNRALLLLKYIHCFRGAAGFASLCAAAVPADCWQGPGPGCAPHRAPGAGWEPARAGSGHAAGHAGDRLARAGAHALGLFQIGAQMGPRRSAARSVPGLVSVA